MRGHYCTIRYSKCSKNAFKRQYFPCVCCIPLQRTVLYFSVSSRGRIWTKWSLKSILVCVCARDTLAKTELPTVHLIFQRTIVPSSAVYENVFFFRAHERKSENLHIFTHCFCTCMFDHLTVVYTSRLN